MIDRAILMISECHSILCHITLHYIQCSSYPIQTRFTPIDLIRSDSRSKRATFASSSHSLTHAARSRMATTNTLVVALAATLLLLVTHGHGALITSLPGVNVSALPFKMYSGCMSALSRNAHELLVRRGTDP